MVTDPSDAHPRSRFVPWLIAVSVTLATVMVVVFLLAVGSLSDSIPVDPVPPTVDEP